VTRFLLTNDDGVDSPALVPFAIALGFRGGVRVVVPDRERSWIAKAVTRFEPLRVDRTEREGVQVWTASGYPADCANLGVHSLGDGRPDVVVSGINVGLNHGAAFMLSSGTVGAAMEGFIAGLPALAFSVGVHHREHDAWVRQTRGAAYRSDWERLSGVCVEILDRVLHVGFPKEADLLNVNMPARADSSTPRRVTSLARVRYDKLFHAQGQGVFAHRFGGFTGPIDEGSDVAAHRRDEISVTPIKVANSATVATAFRQAIED
jgi:5'-nucleotidase